MSFPDHFTQHRCFTRCWFFAGETSWRRSPVGSCFHHSDTKPPWRLLARYIFIVSVEAERLVIDRCHQTEHQSATAEPIKITSTRWSVLLRCCQSKLALTVILAVIYAFIYMLLLLLSAWIYHKNLTACSDCGPVVTGGTADTPSHSLWEHAQNSPIRSLAPWEINVHVK